MFNKLINKSYAYILLLSSFLLIAFSACDDDNSTSVITIDDIDIERAVGSMEYVTNIYDDIISAGGDEALALDSIKNYFESDTSVKYVAMDEYNLSIEFNSGIRMGFYTDMEETEGEEPPDAFKKATIPNVQVGGNSNNKIQKIPKSNKTIILSPNYWERESYVDNIYFSADSNFNKTNLLGFALRTGSSCDLEQFTNLSDYRVVHVYTHGIPFPKIANMEEIYILTGEIVSRATHNKYTDDIKAGNIVFSNVKIDGTGKRAWHYAISPSFIAKHNDFSKSHTLFYGGYCFSFLGSWREAIVDDAGAGAYVGFDWSVQTKWNAKWARKYYEKLSDTSFAEPLTLFQAYNSYHQNYYTKKWEKYVSVNIYGDKDLTLWDNFSVEISPATLNGELGKSYTFTANIIGRAIDELYFKWDFADGSDLVSGHGNYQVTHSFDDEDTYYITVFVYDTSNDLLLGEAQSEVIIIEGTDNEDLLELQSMDYLDIEFEADIETVDREGRWFNGVGIENEDINNPENFNCPLTWNGTSFSVNCDGSYEVYSYGELVDTYYYTIKINGEFASDLKTIMSLTAAKTTVRVDPERGEAEREEEKQFIRIDGLVIDDIYPDYRAGFAYQEDTRIYVKEVSIVRTEYNEGAEPDIYTSGKILWNSEDIDPSIEITFKKME